MAKREQRLQARQLRSQGQSLKQIAKALGVAKSSVSYWVRDIELTEEQVAQLKQRQRSYPAQYNGARTNREKHRKLREQYQQAGRERARENNPFHLAGCMLYWAEGAKERNRVNFVNSDPNMMQLFVRFLREEFDIDDKAMSLHIHCHTKDRLEIERIESYWTELLNLPTSCLRKTMFKQGSDSRHNRLVNGVCGLKVHKTELVQHIYGAIQEYGGFENPAWLD